MLVYIDTNIVIDFLRERKSEVGRDLGAVAGKLFDRALDGEFDIVVSEWMEEELYNHVPKNDAEMLFSMLEERIEKVDYTTEDKERAKTLDEEDWDDALHAVLADKAEADYLATQNITDYTSVMKLIKVRKPSDI
jgi:predicted nucleic acid-binding protein